MQQKVFEAQYVIYNIFTIRALLILHILRYVCVYIYEIHIHTHACTTTGTYMHEYMCALRSTCLYYTYMRVRVHRRDRIDVQQINETDKIIYIAHVLH